MPILTIVKFCFNVAVFRLSLVKMYTSTFQWNYLEVLVFVVVVTKVAASDVKCPTPTPTPSLQNFLTSTPTFPKFPTPDYLT